MKAFTITLAATLGMACAIPSAHTATPANETPGAPCPTVDRSKKPEAAPLPSVTFPDAITTTLPNGLRIYVLPTKKQPTVTYRLLIKSGDIFDGAKPGLADLTANMLNKGTEELTADEFAKKTDFIGASVEASSSDDSLSIMAVGLAKYSGELLEFMRDLVLRPAFRPDELDKEKVKAVSNLVQKKMEPADLASRLRDKLLYGSHPYGAYATPESVQSITRDDLVKFQQAYFLPNNATLIVVGDVDPAAIQSRIKGVFGDWKSNPTPKLDLPAFPPIKGISFHLVDRPSSVQSNVVVSAAGVPRNNPDTPELSVINSVLGGGMSGRLFANLREKHGFTYGSYSTFNLKRLGGSFSATAEVRNAVTAPAITEILNELNRITSEPIPETEVDRQKSYLSGNFLLSLESEQRTAERLQEIDLYGLPEDFYKHYAQRITEVTPEKATELAKKYIDPKDLVIVVVGAAKEVLPQLQTLGAVTVYNTDLKKVSEAPMQAAAPSPESAASARTEPK